VYKEIDSNEDLRKQSSRTKLVFSQSSKLFFLSKCTTLNKKGLNSKGY